MNIWLHRIKHQSQVSYPLLDPNHQQNQGRNYTYLSTGWPDLGSGGIDVINKIKQGNETQEIENCYYGPRRKTFVKNFVVHMKQGDWVLVPTYWGYFSIYEILEDEAIPVADFDIPVDFKDSNGKLLKKNTDNYSCYEVENKITIVDLGFFRKVKKVEIFLPKYQYANEKLTRKMKYFGTNLNITECKNDINQAIEAFRNKQPINLSSIILNRNVSATLEEIKKNLNPSKLENLVSWYFSKLGATNVIAGNKKSEGDVDVIANFEHLNFDIYVQVKHHKGITGGFAVNQVKEYYENISDIEEKGQVVSCWVISTGDDFSEEAKNIAIEYNVRLITGEDFATMLLKVGIDGLTV